MSLCQQNPLAAPQDKPIFRLAPNPPTGSRYRLIPPRALMWAALFGSLFTVLWGLGSYPLLQPDEGRNAEIAREMLASGDWLIPTYNGLPYLDKPAFFFKAVALSFAVFGENEAAARLPSALFGLATLGLIYGFCRRHYGAVTAAAAVLVIATTPLFFAFSRFVIFDMTLGFFVSATILACFSAAEAEGRRRTRYYVLGAALAGIATVVKGPVGFIVPSLVMAVFHTWSGLRGWWRDAFGWRNVLVFLAIVVPWFVGVSLQHPDFPYYGLIKESLQRFTTNEFRRTAPFYYYALVIGLCFFPWSLLLPEAMARAWRSRTSWRAVDRLFVAWALVVVVFFSLSQSKLPGYILTAVIALGVLVARVVVHAWEQPNDAGAMRRAALCFALLALPAAILCLIPLVDPEVLRAAAPRTARYLDSLAGALVWLARLFAACGALALIGFLRRDNRVATAAFLLFGLLLVPVLAAHMKTYVEHRSAAGLARTMPPLSDDTIVVCYRCYPNGYSFYSKRGITVISSRDGYELQSNYIRYTLQKTADWPPNMVREGDFHHWLQRQDCPLFLLAKNGEVERFRALLGDRNVFFSRLTPDFAGTLLLSKRQD